MHFQGLPDRIGGFFKIFFKDLYTKYRELKKKVKGVFREKIVKDF